MVLLYDRTYSPVKGKMKYFSRFLQKEECGLIRKKRANSKKVWEKRAKTQKSPKLLPCHCEHRGEHDYDGAEQRADLDWRRNGDSVGRRDAAAYPLSSCLSIQVIRPFLHHLLALVEILSLIVNCSDCILIFMG